MSPQSLPHYLVVADDLSGAADCAAGFASAGLSTRVLLDAQASTGAQGDVAVLTVDTNSRRDTAAEAAAKLQAVLAAPASQGRRVLKKIDSTLRGGWAQEVAVLQAALHAIALVAPAFPQMARTMQGGVVYVHGVRLADTATWQLEHADREDRAAQQLQAAGLRCDNLPASLLDAGPEATAQAIANAREQGVQALVFDVLTDKHLQTLAQASLQIEQAFCVCSAGLSHALAQQVQPVSASPASLDVPHAAGRLPSVVTVVGSMSAIAQQQLAYLAEQPRTRLHVVLPGCLRSDVQTTQGQTLVQTLVQTISDEVAQGLDVVVSLGADAHTDPAEGPMLARQLARLLHAPMAAAAGLVITGGETARAVLEELQLRSLRVHSESEPGVVLCITENQNIEQGTPRQWIATKAGAFGHPASLQRASCAIHSLLAAQPPGGRTDTLPTESKQR
nr:four-carbon acid sugar kinase family protein [Comamonas koreensis]